MNLYKVSTMQKVIIACCTLNNIALEMGEETFPTEKEEVKWHVGDRCLALYSEDGVEYPAVVRVVREWKKTCIVKFDGYDNEKEVGWGNMKKERQGPGPTPVSETAAAVEGKAYRDSLLRLF